MLQSGVLETTVSLAHAAVVVARQALAPPSPSSLEHSRMASDDPDSSHGGHSNGETSAASAGASAAHLAWNCAGAELCAGVAEPSLKLLSMVAACDESAATDALLDAGGLLALRAALATSATTTTSGGAGVSAAAAAEPRSPLFAPSSQEEGPSFEQPLNPSSSLSGPLLKALRQCRLHAALCASNVAAGTLVQRSRLLEAREVRGRGVGGVARVHWSVSVKLFVTTCACIFLHGLEAFHVLHLLCVWRRISLYRRYVCPPRLARVAAGAEARPSK